MTVVIRHGNEARTPHTPLTHPRRLSDAILRGAKLRPQAYGGFYDAGKTCVLGAAMEGAFGSEEFMFYATADTKGNVLRVLMALLTQLYPELNAPCSVPCPSCGLPPEWQIQSPPLRSWVIHLNDTHHLSRERIVHELQKAHL